jgi:hypothetical protein
MDNAIVCNKHDIILRKIIRGQTYSIEFNLQNDDIIIRNIINFKIYDLIAELNKDVVEKIQTIKESEDGTERDILFVFKRFGKELGILQKFMTIRSTLEQDDKQVRLLSRSINTGISVPNCKEMKSNYSNLSVDFITEHNINVKYEFNIDIEEDLPSYMENIIGFLMKKIFYRVKIFIENIK